MQRGLGLLLIIISALSFGALAIFARIAYDAGADPITVLFVRFVIASAVMGGIMGAWRLRFPRGRILLNLALMGGIGYVAQSLAYFMALTMASASLVALLLYLYPVLVTALSAIFLRERITPVKLAALVCALVGAALTIGPAGGGQPLGIALGVATSVIYAVYILVGSRVTARTGAIPSSAVIMTAAALVYATIAAIQGVHFPTTIAGWSAIVAIALISTVLAIVTFFAGLERVGPTNAATLSTFEPLVTVLLAVLFLHERIMLVQIVGGGLILVAVILLARSETRQTRAADGYLPTVSER
ncbi:MAG TPA: DMT family transporter [Herpetosiphonaceae bacterium]